MLSFVVAISENNVIGKNNTLPWRIPEDLKHFKNVTSSKSKTMIMGRRTFESLPGILPGRKHIVLSRDKNYQVDSPDVEVINNINALVPYIKDEREYFVIGGAEIFALLFPYAKRMYITFIHESFEGDTFFPAYDMDAWRILDRREGTVFDSNKYPHSYLTLERIDAHIPSLS